MTNPKPKYKLVLGDPCCSSECDSYARNEKEGDWCIENNCDTSEGELCILGLLEQRDQYKQERDEARRTICQSAQLSQIEWGDGEKPLREIAKESGWDCFEDDD